MSADQTNRTQPNKAATTAAPHGIDSNCCPGDEPFIRDARWHRAARRALLLSWVSLVWMTLEGGAGLYAGVRASSVSLVGWALSSVVEGLASIIVIWRLTGSRTLSETSERTAQKAVAVSFWLLAPYIAYRPPTTCSLERTRPSPDWGWD